MIYLKSEPLLLVVEYIQVPSKYVISVLVTTDLAFSILNLNSLGFSRN